MIIVKPVDEKGCLNIQKLYEKYSIFLKEGTRVMCFFNRVFNENKKTVKKLNESIEAKFIENQYHPKIDLMPMRKKHGVAKGYYAEIIASNIVLEEEGKKIIVPVFPNEITLDCDYGIENVIKSEIEILKNVGRSYETIGLLHERGLEKIAEDFREAMVKLEESNYEGSINCFRKVIEGFKKYTKDHQIETKNRTDAIRDFLAKTYHLMSNFGMHAETKGFFEEAILSKDITTAVSEYITKKM